MVSSRIKHLRESNDMTQAELARHLGITRSSVNAWEMGISVPSTQCIVELACLFDVSTDYLLGLGATSSLQLDGLTAEDVEVIYGLVRHLREKNSGNRDPER